MIYHEPKWIDQIALMLKVGYIGMKNELSAIQFGTCIINFYVRLQSIIIPMMMGWREEKTSEQIYLRVKTEKMWHVKNGEWKLDFE